VLILHLGMEVMQILMRIEVKKNVLCISFFVTSKIFPLLYLVHVFFFLYPHSMVFIIANTELQAPVIVFFFACVLIKYAIVYKIFLCFGKLNCFILLSSWCDINKFILEDGIFKENNCDQKYETICFNTNNNER
jgi:hypothetical protein